jgi:pimeloyl-ACP methyl ester carboxylesterase
MNLNFTPSFYDGQVGKLAYDQQKGSSPGIIFLHGFNSDMLGGKATALAEFCAQQNNGRQQAYLRFDCRAHGQSEGEFKDFTIGGALQDALAMLDDLTDGKQIIVGSSMGGWLAFLLALYRPERIAAIIGLAPAPDFTDQIYFDDLTDDQRREVDKTGECLLSSDYGGHYLITKKLIEDGRNHFVIGRLREIKCPLRIMHGKKDDDVRWQQSNDIIARWGGADKAVTFIDDGDHRLSRDADIDLLKTCLTDLLVQI